MIAGGFASVYQQEVRTWSRQQQSWLSVMPKFNA
jgi:hypothetical protein